MACWRHCRMPEHKHQISMYSPMCFKVPICGDTEPLKLFVLIEISRKCFSWPIFDESSSPSNPSLSVPMQLTLFKLFPNLRLTRDGDAYMSSVMRPLSALFSRLRYLRLCSFQSSGGIVPCRQLLSSESRSS